MRLTVSVPVLSVHNTVAEPSASMVAARRVSTRWLERRYAPMAMNTVRISRNSCGSMAMAMVMPASAAPNQSPRAQAYSKPTTTLTNSPNTENHRTMWRVCRCSGVASTGRVPSTLPMRPMSLRAPVAVTSARAWPATTRVPANTVPAVALSACLATGSDSPLSRDSSTRRSLDRISRASAGTRSPSASSMRSPTTSSVPATRCRSPSRHTSARGLVMSCKASSTRSVRRSCTSVMPTMTARNASSTRASERSPSSR